MGGLTVFALLILGGILLVLLGLAGFLINLWIVKMGAALLGYSLTGDMAVLSAAILTAASLLGAGYGHNRKYKF